MSILVTKNLKKYYGSGETLVKALDGVDLAIEKGEFVSVVGRSGSGKSTLLHMLGGLDIPTSGEVIVADQNLGAMKKDALTIFRRREIGFVFQDYNLLPLLNVYENIVLPIQLDGGKPDRGFVEDLLNTLGIRKEIRYAKRFVGGPAAAGGNRQGAGGEAIHSSGRRAHGKSGFQDEHGCAGPPWHQRPAVWTDGCDDHPQRGDRPDGGTHHPS